jgi:transcriptional regulator with XRE-family HTH domain
MYRLRYQKLVFMFKKPIIYSIRYMNFGEAGPLIREARHKVGLTQAELASRLHMSRATISKIENGIIEEIGIRKLARLADRLDLEIVVRPRRRLTLHEVYEKNRQERRAALHETDAVLAKLKPDARW